MVRAGEAYFLIARGRALRWSMEGYRKVSGAIENAMLLTPPSTLRAFGVGYRPLLHPSALH